MKKGMLVKLEDGKEIILIDSVTHKDNKFFAATPNDDSIEDLNFYRVLYDDKGSEYLEEINYNDYPEVIDALVNHIMTLSVN